MKPRFPRDWTLATLVLIFVVSATWTARSTANDAAASQRLGRLTQYLASDALEGRGLETAGIHVAAERIAAEFRELGLKTDFLEDGPFQPFEVTTSARLGEDNRLALQRIPRGGAPPRPGLDATRDFTPLAVGGSGAFRLPLAFVGYGITAADLDYDDYAGIDAAGKAIIVLRHEPQQNNPHSLFDGTDHSNHATFRSKLSNAYQHGAKAVIFVTSKPEIERRIEQATGSRDKALDELVALYADRDPHAADDATPEWTAEVLRVARAVARFEAQIAAEQDPVLGFERAGRGGERRDLPVLHVRRGVIDSILEADGRPSLAQLEAEIDADLKPHSFDLDAWQAIGQATIDRITVTTKNVVGVLPGEGPAGDEVIVIGAHYDHLGRGEEGSAAAGNEDIHNGADDNASGIATLIEIARQLANREVPPPRTFVFIAFSGEERGLLGSAAYVEDPVFDLDNTIAMLNLDMVGRMQNDELIVNGSGTAEQFDAWIDSLNDDHGFSISKSEGGFGPSDHSTFYAREIPVLHFFTGLHADYHKPTDDFELVNIEGMRRIARFVAAMAEQIAAAPERPTYVATGRDRQTALASGDRPYLGSIPAFPQRGDGYEISGVAKEGPAAVGGMQAGDKIIQFGDARIANLEDIDSALRKFKGGDRVPVVVRRDNKEVQLEVTLEPPR